MSGLIHIVTDGKAMLAETAKGFELGTTKVKCNHGIERKASEKKYTPIEGVGIVSEKALKGQAITHSVEYAFLVQNTIVPLDTNW